MKKPVIIKNADILFGKDLQLIKGSIITINELGTIVDISKEDILDKKTKNVSSTATTATTNIIENANIIDAEGFMLIPGLVNSHTHIGDSIGKDISSSASLDSRVNPNHSIKKTILEKTKEEQLKQMIKNTAISMLHKGITTFIDFREGGLEGVLLLVDALRDIPIRKIILGRVDLHNNSYDKLNNKYKEDKKKYTPNNNNDNNSSNNSSIVASSTNNIFYDYKFVNEGKKILEICDGFGLSGANENPDNILLLYNKTVKDFIKDKKRLEKRKKPIKAIHVAETSQTVDKSQKETNKTEIERTINTLDPDVYIHVTNPSERDLEILDTYRKGIVVCPRANGILGAGLIPLKKILNLNCEIAIGTDNIMLNSPDMFREMDFLIKSQRALEKDPSFLDPKEVLKMATTNSGRIFNLNIGCIDEGYQADLIFIDKYDVDIYPLHDPHMSIVQRCSERQIAAVMIDGKFVIEKTLIN